MAKKHLSGKATARIKRTPRINAKASRVSVQKKILAKNRAPRPEKQSVAIAPIGERTQQHSSEDFGLLPGFAGVFAKLAPEFASSGVTTIVIPVTGTRISVEVEGSPEQHEKTFAKCTPAERAFALTFLNVAKRLGKLKRSTN